VFIGSLVSSALGFVCLFFITNFVGVEAYGQVILMVSILTTINVVADLGNSSSYIKRIFEGRDIDDCISTCVCAARGIKKSMYLMLINRSP
jgi:O-antigen/teichoic acid export membrane protein